MDAVIFPDDLVLEYLAEGAANVVYTLNSPAAAHRTKESISQTLSGQLLRLRKALPARVPVEQSHREYRDIFQQILPAENLVKQELVSIPQKLLQACNNSLRIDELAGTRPYKRFGLYLAIEERHGLLISNMSPRRPEEILFQIKPKWLIQSPSAPVDSRRCRTCALRARNNRLRREQGKDEVEAFCPLDLCSAEIRRQQKAMKLILEDPNQQAQDATLANVIIKRLNESGVLRKLAQLQSQLDPHGVLESDLNSQAFRIAMTLRDCTLFVRVRKDADPAVELRLGDLDLKSSKEGKGEYWISIEKELRDNGWYNGTEKSPGSYSSTWCRL